MSESTFMVARNTDEVIIGIIEKDDLTDRTISIMCPVAIYADHKIWLVSLATIANSGPDLGDEFSVKGVSLGRKIVICGYSYALPIGDDALWHFFNDPAWTELTRSWRYWVREPDPPETPEEREAREKRARWDDEMRRMRRGRRP